MNLQTLSLLLLRASLGWLMVLWGLDKILNVEHAVRVSEGFYGGLVTAQSAWRLVGWAQIGLGLLVTAGLVRRVVYPVLLVVTGVTLVAVWKSIVDPFGLVMDGGNLIFFPSSTIFFGGLTVLAFRAQDLLSVDAWLARRTVAGAGGAGAASRP